MQEQPLSGITVLDFGQVYNGPYCGFLLAQAGARVIKVESPRGESLRARGNGPASYPFAALNSGKESITLNIREAAGQALLKQLAPHADVLLENYAPGTMDRYGVGAEALRAINPRLVYASSTGYGTSAGPYRDFLGMDLTLQAMTGVMSITGERGAGPTKTGATLADMSGGAHLYAAIVSALFARERSGVGATVDISMQDCVFPMLATGLGTYYSTGALPERSGNGHPSRALAPYNVYPTADGYVAILCIRNGHWRKLCAAMGRPELADDGRYKVMADRGERTDEVDAIVSAWTSTLTKAEVFEVGQAHGVICAPVNTMQDVVNDPHLQARGTVEHREHPTLGAVVQMHTPLRYKGLEPPELTDVPALGAQTEAVLAEFLGADAEAVQRLRDESAI